MKDKQLVRCRTIYEKRKTKPKNKCKNHEKLCSSDNLEEFGNRFKMSKVI